MQGGGKVSHRQKAIGCCRCDVCLCTFDDCIAINLRIINGAVVHCEEQVSRKNTGQVGSPGQATPGRFSLFLSLSGGLPREPELAVSGCQVVTVNKYQSHMKGQPPQSTGASRPAGCKFELDTRQRQGRRQGLPVAWIFISYIKRKRERNRPRHDFTVKSSVSPNDA